MVEFPEVNKGCHMRLGNHYVWLFYCIRFHRIAMDLKSPLSSLFLIRDVGAELEMARVSRALVQMAPTALWLLGVM